MRSIRSLCLPSSALSILAVSAGAQTLVAHYELNETTGALC